MPVVSIPLEENNRSILSNAYFKIIEDIIDTIKIPKSSVIVVHKDIEVALTDNKTNVTNIQSNNLPSTYSKRHVLASITEEYNEDELTTTAVHSQYTYPIFQDHDINVYIYPIYIKSDISIEFSFMSPSKSEANRIRDDIRIRLSQTRNINIHDIEYNILIPTVVEDFISDIHTLKSRLVPQPLEDYFREHSTKRINLLTDMANKENTKIAVNEKQIRIVGLFDFNSMPEKIDIDNENNNYKISFTYKLSMDVPRAIAMKYPVMVCNRPLPSKYLQFIEDNKTLSKEESNRDSNYTNFGLYNLSIFEAHRQLENRVDIKLPLNVPLFDEFNIRQGHKGYCILASFLTDVNEDDKKTLFNLKNIEPFYIHNDILQFILNGERLHVVNPYMSFLYFGLYQDDIHFDNNILDIDENLNVVSKIPLSLFKPIRVTISFILDITVLDQRAIERLLNNKDILNIFISEYIKVYNNFKTELSGNILPYNTFYRTFIYIINYLINKDDKTTVKNIIDTLRSDKYLFSNIASIIYNNYPNIYRYLNNNGILTIGDVDASLNRSYKDSENYVMRTVQTNYIVGLQKDS